MRNSPKFPLRFHHGDFGFGRLRRRIDASFRFPNRPRLFRGRFRFRRGRGGRALGNDNFVMLRLNLGIDERFNGFLDNGG